MNDRSVTSETKNQHGTQVAGVLGAATDNGEGIAGIAPDARIMPVRTADNILHQGSRLAAGIVWATDHGADVISMSLGAESRSAALDRAVAYAHQKGVVLVAATGNESANHHNYPATYDEVIAVGGMNPTPPTPPRRARSSRRRRSPPTSRYARRTPTTARTSTWSRPPRSRRPSTAAAIRATGAAPRPRRRTWPVWRRSSRPRQPSLCPVEMRQLLIGTADDLSGDQNDSKAGWDQFTGYGRVNAFEAVKAAKEGKIPPGTDITAPDLFSPTESARSRARRRQRLGARSWGRANSRPTGR